MSLVDNTHFLLFNAAKRSYSLIAIQNQLLMSAKENINGQQTKQYKDMNFKKRINILKVSWGD